jgi:peptidoglycan hydrolase-like protein with peptidoglycan-binding domain
MRLPWKNLLVLYVLIFSGVALATAATEPVKAPQNLPASVSPELEKAAKALAEGQLDTASRWFEAAAQNTSVRPFIRGLSMFGLAQVELARQDAGAAIAAVCLRWAWPPPFNLSNVVCFRASAGQVGEQDGHAEPSDAGAIRARQQTAGAYADWHRPRNGANPISFYPTPITATVAHRATIRPAQRSP